MKNVLVVSTGEVDNKLGILNAEELLELLTPHFVAGIHSNVPSFSILLKHKIALVLNVILYVENYNKCIFI